jgi:hypothetical protein
LLAGPFLIGRQAVNGDTKRPHARLPQSQAIDVSASWRRSFKTSGLNLRGCAKRSISSASHLEFPPIIANTGAAGESAGRASAGLTRTEVGPAGRINPKLLIDPRSSAPAPVAPAHRYLLRASTWAASSRTLLGDLGSLFADSDLNDAIRLLAELQSNLKRSVLLLVAIRDSTFPLAVLLPLRASVSSLLPSLPCALLHLALPRVPASPYRPEFARHRRARQSTSSPRS